MDSYGSFWIHHNYVDVREIVIMARISVLMGIYNCASTLIEALDSLYAQTYQDFKIILCDDGSHDNTYEIAKKYAEKHDNIVLISNGENKGLNYTLNHCLEYADTEYCARMDGDDISLPTRFEKEIEFLDTHLEYAIVSCPMIHFDEKGDFRYGQEKGEPSINSYVINTPFCHAPCMVRTEVYKKVGGYTVSPRLLRVEDYHLWAKMFAAGYRGYTLPEHLYKMRDDRDAVKRRTWQARKNEMYVKYLGSKMLNIPWYYWFYIIKPLIAYVIPPFIYRIIHKYAK